MWKQQWKCILPFKFIFRWCKKTLKEKLFKSAAWIWSKGKTIVKTDKMIKRYILLAWGIKTELLKTNSILKKITSTRSIFVTKTVLFTLWEEHTVRKRLKNKHNQATAPQNGLGFYTFICVCALTIHLHKNGHLGNQEQLEFSPVSGNHFHTSLIILFCQFARQSPAKIYQENRLNHCKSDVGFMWSQAPKKEKTHTGFSLGCCIWKRLSK